MKEQIPTAEDSPLVSEFLSRIASVQEEAKWECRECGLKVVPLICDGRPNGGRCLNCLWREAQSIRVEVESGMNFKN